MYALCDWKTHLAFSFHLSKINAGVLSEPNNFQFLCEKETIFLPRK